MSLESPRAELDARQEAFLQTCLRELLPGADDELLRQWRSPLRPAPLSAGQLLMQQGEPGDSMHLLLSGRLRASIKTEDGGRLDVAGGHLMAREKNGQLVPERAVYRVSLAIQQGETLPADLSRQTLRGHITIHARAEAPGLRYVRQASAVLVREFGF
jgi:CRP-like cAMP-binding protein